MTAVCKDEMYDNFTGMQSEFFENQHVLVIVPHQDDDLNLAGGVIEQYTGHGSRVSVVFCTNGDYYEGKVELRFREALEVLARCGVAAQDVHFLGFGDQWTAMEADGQWLQHIYNSPIRDLVWTSYAGRTATYGAEAKDCYAQVPYTREEYLNSLKHLIQELRPDVIFVNDTDYHIDHKAVSYFFEEAMGQLLKEDDTYRPTVYKGYCYSTAWEAETDFLDTLNILSTKETEHIDNGTTWKPYYHWDDRVRLPVDNTGLHRLLSQTQSCQLLKLYDSQLAINHAQQVTNGDKVVWRRNTHSVLYNARMTVVGEETELLNDFKLLDSSDIAKARADLGVVDVSGGVSVTLDAAVTLVQLGLYDDPDEGRNILAGQVLLPDGTAVPFGALDPTGAVTYVDMPETELTAFTVEITAYEGDAPGLMELEGYATVPEPETGYFLMVDEEDNVVYDYIVENRDGTVELSLYSYPEAVSWSDVEIRFTGNEGCTYELAGDTLLVSCPNPGDACMVELVRGETVCRARFSHVSAATQVLMNVLQEVDAAVTCDVEGPLSWEGQVNYYSMMFERMVVKFLKLL